MASFPAARAFTRVVSSSSSSSGAAREFVFVVPPAAASCYSNARREKERRPSKKGGGGFRIEPEDPLLRMDEQMWVSTREGENNKSRITASDGKIKLLIARTSLGFEVEFTTLRAVFSYRPIINTSHDY